MSRVRRLETAFLDAARVRQLLQPQALIDAMQQALTALSRRDGTVLQPVRTTLPIEQHGGFLGLMPALSYQDGGALGVKLVAFYPQLPAPLVTHHAIVALFDVPTGRPLAVMDGSVITEERTAAVSAVSARLLSREDSSIVAILGAGHQARSHAKYLSLVRPVREVRIWSRSDTSANAAVSDIQKELPECRVIACAEAEQAVVGADIVATVSAATTPILKGAWLKPGAHVIGVGACVATWRELDDDVMRNVVIVDSREVCVTVCAFQSVFV
eukprot:TRINITY_DN2458_c0_g1_i1.p1 TRINITY_DN2458_c0_g1~~TRINITY_DN2458_c0_g1_i1.p1  ORF type:complete len:271 (-),score=74.15 TRINITY_DN2458_c0_g1_i1:249-1061(-)